MGNLFVNGGKKRKVRCVAPSHWILIQWLKVYLRPEEDLFCSVFEIHVFYCAASLLPIHLPLIGAIWCFDLLYIALIPIIVMLPVPRSLLEPLP